MKYEISVPSLARGESRLAWLRALHLWVLRAMALKAQAHELPLSCVLIIDGQRKIRPVLEVLDMVHVCGWRVSSPGLACLALISIQFQDLGPHTQPIHRLVKAMLFTRIYKFLCVDHIHTKAKAATTRSCLRPRKRVIKEVLTCEMPTADLSPPDPRY